MSLLGAIQEISQQNAAAGQPTDYVVGTVTGVNPLEITINTAMAPLRESVLLLTESVVEKKIPVLSHSHYIPAGTLTHSHGGAVGQDLTGQYQTNESLLSAGADTALQGADIVCWEHGKALPVEDGYIILNRKLEMGDQVLLVRVAHGQRYIILSRVVEHGGG